MNITIIGAGPRGLMTLGRLIAWQTERNKEATAITIVDAYPVGGHVWRTDQPTELIMNTPTQQITVFADNSVKMAGPNTVTGPNLSEWFHLPETATYIRQQNYQHAAFFLEQIATLGPNDYASRALYGVYLQWVYDRLLTQLPANTTVNLVQDTVTHLIPLKPGFTVQTATAEWPADHVALTIGHYVMRPTDEQRRFTEVSRQNHGFYLPPILPGDANFDAIEAGQTVLMRGVGLSFYDYTAMLTEGRGGHFTRQTNGQLVYEASGNEPRIIAGSRRGFPYYPKGHNEKAYGEQATAFFLTEERLLKLAKEHPISGQDFYTLLKRDVELVYYTRLIEHSYPNKDAEEFKRAFVTAKYPDDVITEAAFQPAEILDWEALVNPFNRNNVNQVQTTIETRIAEMTADAKLGTKTGPLTSALEVFRDLRDKIRFAVEHNLFEQDDYLNFLLRWYTPMQDFISVGPPLIRLEQLQALMASGLVKFMKPEMQVRVENGQFVAQAKDDAQTYTAQALIEARTPGVNLTNNANPLIENLLADGVAAPDQRKLSDGTRYFTHAIAIDPLTDQVIDHNNAVVTDLYVFGIPTEGVHWMTTASPRPGVNDGNLIAADRIAEQMVTDQHEFEDHLMQ